MTETHQKIAELLMILWRGVPKDYKRRYLRNIWGQFEANIRSAAYTSSLSKFINSLSLKMVATIGVNEAERARAQELLRQADSKQWLKLLREDTTLLVLMVRVEVQERREVWEAEHKTGEEFRPTSGEFRDFMEGMSENDNI